MSSTLRRPGLVVVALTLLTLSCGQNEDNAASDSITLYTCASDTTVQPVLAAFEEENPGTTVELFRATTGELNARVAGDVRSGGLKADAVWGCDPLTMQGWVEQGLVGGWTPEEAAAIPEQYRTDEYVGVAVLYMVAVYHDGVPAPKAWSDLAGPDLTVALPDPTVAASALGALGYFATADGYGTDFYSRLNAGGAVQVGTPDEVTAGVAQGTYDAGMTIANSAYLAQKDGSPIGVVWPEPGAVAIYGPIAVTKDSDNPELAQAFMSFVVSERGQTLVAESGSYPTMPDIPGPTIPADAPIVYPDWATIAGQKDSLLGDYQQLFGG